VDIASAKPYTGDSSLLNPRPVLFSVQADPHQIVKCLTCIYITANTQRAFLVRIQPFVLEVLQLVYVVDYRLEVGIIKDNCSYHPAEHLVR
jgi:hypothetical protein